MVKHCILIQLAARLKVWNSKYCRNFYRILNHCSLSIGFAMIIGIALTMIAGSFWAVLSFSSQITSIWSFIWHLFMIVLLMAVIFYISAMLWAELGYWITRKLKNKQSFVSTIWQTCKSIASGTRHTWRYLKVNIRDAAVQDKLKQTNVPFTVHQPIKKSFHRPLKKTSGKKIPHKPSRIGHAHFKPKPNNDWSNFVKQTKMKKPSKPIRTQHRHLRQSNPDNQASQLPSRAREHSFNGKLKRDARKAKDRITRRFKNPSKRSREHRFNQMLKQDAKKAEVKIRHKLQN